MNLRITIRAPSISRAANPATIGPSAVMACQRTVSSLLHKAPMSGFMTLEGGSWSNSSITASMSEDPSSLLMRRFSWIPIAGTRHEHALTKEEVDMLDETFGGTLTMHTTPFVIFSHLAMVLTRGKLPALERVGGVLDRFFDRIFPFLRKQSLHQVLIMTKQIP